MSRICDVSAKGRQRGFKVSHAHNKSIRAWNANLQTKRLYDSESGRWVKLKVSTRVLRTISKKGLAATLLDEGLKISDVTV